MSKLRIYELAKELGVDNKAVILKAEALGMEGKASHSNTLSDEEVAQLRRAFIRQAIGGSEATIVRTNSKGETVTQRRDGNIIRRRRGGEEKVSVVEEPISAPVEVVTEVSSSETIQEVQRENSDEVISNHASIESNALAEPAVELKEPEPSQEVPVAATEVSTPTEPEKTTRPGGARVLGKIVLPQAPRREEVAPRVSQASAPGLQRRAEVVSDEDEQNRKAKKDIKGGRKTRKVEFSRGELVDYDNFRSHRKARGGKGRDRKEDETENQEAAQKAAPTKSSKRVIKVDEVVTVGNLAKEMSLKVSEVVAKLLQLGVMATINQVLDFDTATIVASEFGYQVESVSLLQSLQVEEEGQQDATKLVPRPPVVTVMGHVDHGKTTLLDTIREASVAKKEFGGITQHIGAYTVKLPGDKAITFIDTPGHEAFSAMRARGAKVTDIVILVVAANDGVMPQTIEALNHAKAADVPIIVAVNKIDVYGSTPDRIKTQLAEHGLQPEEWGGDTMYYHVSALKNEGVDKLLEGVMLLAEMKELKANPDRRAKGIVLESRQDRGRGIVATVLVQQGTLKNGDLFVAGSEYGRVRTMIDDHHTVLKAATPSMPVEITGLSGIPVTGDDFFVVENEARAKEVASARSQMHKLKEQAASGAKVSLEEFSKMATQATLPELNIILKVDVQGSLEAVKSSLERLPSDKVKVKVLHSGVGGITESDLQLALASRSIIVGFCVRADSRVAGEAEQMGLEIRFYRVIYNLIEDIRKAMAGLLAPLKKENILGQAQVREVFNISKTGTVAGCMVSQGLVRRSANARLLRDNIVVHEGKLSGLKRFKEDAREVKEGTECGISLANYNDVKVGDLIEVFEVQEFAATLE